MENGVSKEVRNSLITAVCEEMVRCFLARTN